METDLDIQTRSRSNSNADPSDILKIGAVARRYGLTLRTLRFYENRGLVRPLRQGSERLYTKDDCRRIELVLRGKLMGHNLSAIAAMLQNGDFDARPDLVAGSQMVAAQIDRLLCKRHELDRAINELLSVQREMIARAPRWLD